jgi:hypothetical protein
MSPQRPRYLSHDDLESLGLTTAEVVESIEHVLRGVKQSRAWSAPKPVIKPPDGRYLMATLSAADDPPSRGLPPHAVPPSATTAHATQRQVALCICLPLAVRGATH